MKNVFVLLLFMAGFFQCCPAQQIQPFHQGDRIAFLGNSITDGGHYHSYIWLYYMTRFPAQRIDIFNAGIGGDVIKMMYDRLDDDVLSHRPNVIVLTFGMNDTDYGIYLQPDAEKLSEDRVKTSYTNYLLMEKRLKALPSIRKILLTSPPFDETAKLKSPGYPGKNAAMLKINAFMKASAEKNHWGFVDLNAPMSAINLREQAKDSAFSLQGTGRIHPEQDGHMVMAYLFLKAQGWAGREVADVKIDAASKNVQSARNCKITNLAAGAGSVSFDYLAASLPYPIDTFVSHGGWGETKTQADALKVIPFIQEFNREMLAVNGLADGNYALNIDGEKIGQWTAGELAEGINLAVQTNTPQYRQAMTIMYMNEERWEIERRLRVYYWYQFDVFRDKGLLFADNQAATDSLNAIAGENVFVRGMMQGYLKAMHPEMRTIWKKEMKLLVDQIYTINKPKKHHITLKKL